ncbi:2381_t:CDS:1, partial [Rhizophagus irregularis]
MVYNKSAKQLNSKREFYGHGFGLCKKALNLAITNGSNKVFEELLQDFIKQQLSVQNENNEQIEHEIDVSKISNLARHK